MKTSDDYFEEIKNAGVNLICGGFPCQDYSVSHSLSTAKGINFCPPKPGSTLITKIISR